MCGSMVDIQSPTAEIRRGKKKERKKKATIESDNMCIFFTVVLSYYVSNNQVDEVDHAE